MQKLQHLELDPLRSSHAASYGCFGAVRSRLGRKDGRGLLSCAVAQSAQGSERAETCQAKPWIRFSQVKGVKGTAKAARKMLHRLPFVIRGWYHCVRDSQ